MAGSPIVSVSFNNPSYSLASSGTCQTIGVPTGKTCTLAIQYFPDGIGAHNAGIILIPDPPSRAAASVVPVLGTATAP